MQETIETLNTTVWCTLRPSPIDGVGVFAVRDIPKGQKIYAKSDEREWLHTANFKGLHREIEYLIRQRWPRAPQGLFYSPNDDARLVSFMNHSNTPNYDYFNDCTLRDIKAGEELLEDYGEFAP